MLRRYSLSIAVLLILQFAFLQIKAQAPGQVALDPANIPQFVDPLPHFAAGMRVDATAGGNLIMKAVAVQQQALSTGTLINGGDNIIGVTPGVGLTSFWSYRISADGGAGWSIPVWPAATIETRVGNPVNVAFRNNLHGQTYDDLNLMVDQTLKWASPMITGDPMYENYSGPVPICVHLHGIEAQSASDGGPFAWFTPGYGLIGPSFQDGVDSVYHYPNLQQEATLWYHDHVMGATRVNIYSGMAGFYLLRGPDEENDHLPGWSGDDLVREVSAPGTSGTYTSLAYLPEIELMIQDREFDTTGQLLFPGDPSVPQSHPFWTPEMFGKVICVNGKSWPYLSVAPRKYRFRILNAANARFFNMWLVNPANGSMGPIIRQVGTDGGLLDNPVEINPSLGEKLLLAPAERADVVIDFTGIMPGTKFILMNSANTPFPGGDPVIEGYTDRIMEFVVNGTMVSAIDSASTGSDLSQVPVSLRDNSIVRLTDFSGGLNIQPVVKRQLTLTEVEENENPLIALINNSRSDNMGLSGTNQFGDTTEFPVEGTTELWQIINTTDDAHPIHLHLVQFQLVSRQAYNKTAFLEAYNSAFPAGIVVPGSGPPFDYKQLNSDSAVGGNPAVGPYLLLPIKMPKPNEKGWKDTYIAFPNEVTTFIVRFAPPTLPLATPGDQLLFSFDPGIGPGYVWHCHILDHEDNEMMRPYRVIPSPWRTASIAENSQDSEFYLGQNTPNPATGTTNLGFFMPGQGHVTIKLYNYLGFEVQTLFDAEALAGLHSISVNTKPLPAGVYLYQMKSGDFTATRKMVVYE